MEMDTKTYEELARAMLGMHNIAKDEDKVFRSFFGAPIRHIVLLWNKIVSKDSLPKGAEPHHIICLREHLLFCSESRIWMNHMVHADLNVVIHIILKQKMDCLI